MAEKDHYNVTKSELEIDSDIENVQYCIKRGMVSMYNEDRTGDITLACVPMRKIPMIIDELQGIYDTYFVGVKYMKYLKSE